MREQIEQLRQEALEAVRQSATEEQLQDVRVKYLGRKGSLTALMKGLGSLTPEERPLVGQVVNRIKDEVEGAVDAALSSARAAATAHRLSSERIDVTLPGRRHRKGSKHPVSLVIEEVSSIFAGLGFSVAEGPEIEKDWYNFEALNFPPEHPARDMQDTFFIQHNPDVLLRTHTSSVQTRVMEKQERILHIAGRMVGCKVKHGEHVLVVVNLRSMIEREAHTREDVYDLILDNRKRMAGSQCYRVGCTGQIDVVT
jgi:phenylalanyl-tRNA synthetase alpha chain